MADGFIVRKGGVTTEQALAPTITEVSTTDNSITFTIKNNDTASATIAFRVSSVTASGQTLTLAADTTSSNLTVSGLDDNTTFTVFATANVTGKVKSDVAEKEITTDDALEVPETISDLHVWFDATKITGLSNNDSVVTWNDSSGNSFNATQSTAGKRPTYRTNQVNSLPVVDFDGTDDNLVIPSSNIASFRRLHSGEGVTYFIVNKKANLTTSNYLGNTNAGTEPGILIQHDLGAGGMYFEIRKNTTGAVFVQFPVGTGTTNLELITVRHGTAQTNNVQIRFNSSTTVNSNYSATPTTNNPGQNLFIGSNAAGTSQFMSGFLCEIIIYNKLLTDTERNNVETYLTNKWGI